MKKRVIITGVAGSGKDYLLGRSQPQLQKQGFSQVNFGEAMQAYATERQAEGRDALRHASPRAAQQLAACVMRDVAELTTNVVLNTHLVLRQEDDFLYGLANIEAFEPTGIVMVWAHPSIIAMRRAADQTRHRPPDTVGVITLHQELERVAAEITAQNLGAHFTSVTNNHADAAAATEALCKGVFYE